MLKQKKICNVSELKEGDIKLFHMKQIEWALAFKEGKYYAFENKCPHQGANLAFGFIENDVVTCPLHAWQFNLVTGKTDEYLSSELLITSVEIKEGEIWVSEPEI